MCAGLQAGISIYLEPLEVDEAHDEARNAGIPVSVREKDDFMTFSTIWKMIAEQFNDPLKICSRPVQTWIFD